MVGYVLTIDDSPAASALYQEILEDMGYRALSVTSGFDALSALEGSVPALVILDVGMQGQSGWDTLRIIRSTAAWEHIPVLIVTELSSLSSVSQGWQLGCSHYLPKPFDRDYLRSGIRSLLSESSCGPRVLQEA